MKELILEIVFILIVAIASWEAGYILGEKRAFRPSDKMEIQIAQHETKLLILESDMKGVKKVLKLR